MNNNTLTKLINKIKENGETGNIGYSTYKELISLARELQVNEFKNKVSF